MGASREEGETNQFTLKTRPGLCSSPGRNPGGIFCPVSFSLDLHSLYLKINFILFTITVCRHGVLGCAYVTEHDCSLRSEDTFVESILALHPYKVEA